MIGPEDATGAVLGAVQSGVSATIQTRAEERKALVDLARSTPAFERAAEAYAARVAAREEVLARIFEKALGAVGLGHLFVKEDLPRQLAQRLPGTAVEEIESVPTRDVIRILEGVAATADDPPIREMYVNLLAAAASTRGGRRTHPSFVTALQEIESDEAVELEALVRRIGRDSLVDGTWGVRPIGLASIVRKHADHTHPIQEHLLNTVDEHGGPREVTRIARWVANWTRLGIVRVSYPALRPPERDWGSARPEFLRWQAAARARSEPTPLVEYGDLWLTEFGSEFLRAVQGLDFPSDAAREHLLATLGPIYSSRTNPHEPVTDEGLAALRMVSAIVSEASLAIPSPTFETVSFSLETGVADIQFYAPLSDEFARAVETGLRNAPFLVLEVAYSEYGQRDGEQVRHQVQRHSDHEQAGEPSP